MSIASTLHPPSPAVVDFASLRSMIAARLQVLLPGPDESPQRLHGAMRHALVGPGKRLRPLLTLLAARRFGGDEAAALEAGCAVEMVHTASLVLDDLPCMDDAELRRGKPATHRAFGEDTAILAAIALLNQAYGVMAALPGVSDTVRLRLVTLMVQAVGPQGLVGGQERDLHDRHGPAATSDVDLLNHQKTGVLFVAALEAGAVLGHAPEEGVAAMRRFGRHLGLAFQTLDDLLDATATAQMAGKDVRQDGGKATLVSLCGLEAARRRVEEHLGQARREVAWPGGPACVLETLLDEMTAILPFPPGSAALPRDGQHAG
ncbi:polyprenyl synthetase family protein [Pseudoroseomonas ludipueritiae]|uniref:Polyprenyl synthetase family protein n=1 Tax=Pseudoroseomonas ludipueritiae TaxID=198093 RepID=A0ABR7R9U9_9PROT|nr:polyprenyl synthetase family protein [Pseudoroseomonas ludipueritiae]MBC9178483.1 polyprenyl synthetase family protein [Pseudoroseomonas ludipueritiae]